MHRGVLQYAQHRTAASAFGTVCFGNFSMKTALLHYWLTTLRGGENVLAELCGIFPDADIFTHAWNPDRVGAPFSSHRITETLIAELPGARNRCQKYLPLLPWALRKLDLSG